MESQNVLPRAAEAPTFSPSPSEGDSGKKLTKQLGQSSEPAAEPPIFRLPDELLHDIVDTIAGAEGLPQQHVLPYRLVLLPLLLTCRRFRHVTERVLYSSIEFFNRDGDCQTPAPGLPELHQLMKSRPDLRPLCKTLKIVFKFSWPRGSLLSGPAEILSFFKNVRTLHITGGYDTDDAETLVHETLRNNPLVENLYLERGLFGIPLRTVCENTNLPRLRKLSLAGTGSFEILTSRMRLISEDKKRTAKFTSLIMGGVSEMPGHLSEFLSWAEALEHFEFDEPLHSTYAKCYGLEAMRSVLEPQRKSLKSIKLGYLRLEENAFLDVSDFPELVELRMLAYNLTCAPETAASKLAAPKLHTLKLRYNVHSGRSWRDAFSPADAKWIRRFAQHAIAIGSSLRRIIIDYLPDAESSGGNLGLFLSWRSPWDMMEEINDIISPHGITLSYTTPEALKDSLLSNTDVIRREQRALLGIVDGCSLLAFNVDK